MAAQDILKEVRRWVAESGFHISISRDTWLLDDRKTRFKYIYRDRVSGNDRLYNDYFAENPVYPSNVFRRRFRMNRPLFLHILNVIQDCDDYFIQKNDVLGRIGLSGLQKMTACIKMLAYGVSADCVDEYVRIGESTTIKSLKRFCEAIIKCFEKEYLRSPTKEDVSRLLKEGESRGFPGMLGSLDCMHWQWKNCPSAWHGQFTGHAQNPTIILEAVASYDLWIWHAFFGMPGSHNDINVLDRSHLFSELAEGRAPLANYTLNGHTYNIGYYLADGIYPKWATIVQSISQPQGLKNKFFTMRQEACRKDVERAFGVLQARFAIIRGPARFWSHKDLRSIMRTCIILHNMIIENEREQSLGTEFDVSDSSPVIQTSHESTLCFSEFLSRHLKIRSSGLHFKLRNDLIEHLWMQYGQEDH
ncbi:uncharacterized protein LOC126686632 [Mercurialis annua]|uniref:uncharacterized protein LOC126686632 n=1 Tax=Mercurialis annua TaxID=3986 RepID=UPI002161063F|nr:uncharacterized protein LOC126686632 [Mercurialis annua]